MTRLFERLSFKRFARRRHARTDRGPVFHQSDLHPLEIFLEPVMIERHRAHHIRPASERDDADPVVRPGFDEFARHFPDRVDPGGLFATDRESFVSIDPETSSASMISIPLASTW